MTGAALPTTKQRARLATLDHTILTLIEDTGCVSKQEIKAQLKAALRSKHRSRVNDRVVDNWWEFAARRQLIEIAPAGPAGTQYASLTDAGRQRRRRVYDAETGWGAVEWYLGIGKAGLPLLISLTALLVAASDQDRKADTATNVLGFAISIGIVFVPTTLLVVAAAAIVRRCRLHAALRNLATDARLPI